jgi:hypothetical protein
VEVGEGGGVTVGVGVGKVGAAVVFEGGGVGAKVGGEIGVAVRLVDGEGVGVTVGEFVFAELVGAMVGV